MIAADLLDGVRVLDLSNVLAGPFAGYQLALMGAEVVKVEVPGSGDLARDLGVDQERSSRGMGVSFLAQNAAKRSVTVNLKHPRGQEVFRRLVSSADVLLENFRPGVMDRLGFGWEALHALRPGLVYCAVSGFGQTGPMRDLPAYDQIVQGLSGVMSTTGTAETAPLRAGFPVCDTLGGFAAAFAVSSALVRRQRTGEGCYLDVSMLETALVAMGWVVSDYVIGGQHPVPMGNENKTAAPSGTFRTADGPLNIAANKQEQFEALLRVLGREELLADPRFAAREERKQHREELRVALEETLTTRGVDEWVARLAGTGVPAAAVLSVPQALDLPQVRERGLLHEVPVDDGTVRVLGSSVHVDRAPVGPSAPPPVLGQHTRVELRGLGYDDETIDALYREGAL